MTRRGEWWKESVGLLLLLAGVVAFAVIVIGLAVALCLGRPPFPAPSDPTSERIDP